MSFGAWIIFAVFCALFLTLSALGAAVIPQRAL